MFAAVLGCFAVSCGSSPKAVHKKPAQRRQAPPAPPTSAKPDLMVGQMCPRAAAGRPAVIPVAVRAGRWRVDPDQNQRLIARRGARQFTVLSWTGKRAGFFQVAGAAQSNGRTMAIGSYAGSLPCHDDEGKPIADCIGATGGCGLALARLEPSGGLKARPFEEDPEPFELSGAAACVARDELAVDVDGDGKHELFERATLTTDGKLAGELVAASSAVRRCSPTSSFAGLAGAVSLVAAADIDSDGRVDIVLSHRAEGREFWALYRAGQTPRRLEQVAVGEVRYSAHSQSAPALPAAPR